MNYETLRDWQEHNECLSCRFWKKDGVLGELNCEHMGTIESNRTWWNMCATKEAIEWNKKE